MTAVLSFPLPFERDQLEFDRNRTSNYLRAVDEASALWCAVAATSNSARC